MSDINQVNNSIKEEFEKAIPNPKKLFAYLFSFRFLTKGSEFAPKEEWRYLSDTEFYDIVGNTFMAKPEFYMDKLYKKVRKRIRKLYGVDRLKEMEKSMIEKFCLKDGEQILFECDGEIEFWERLTIRYFVTSFRGTLYVTNNRIIAQGKIMARSWTYSPGIKWIINRSLRQKCYGYIFPIKNLFKLRKKLKGVIFKKVTYNVDVYKIKIIPKSFTREEDINKLFGILSKHSIEEIKYT